MKNFIYSRLGELIITAMALFLCLIFFSFVTDDYSSFASNLTARQFSNYTYFEFYFGLIGMGAIYTLLYEYFSVYDWMGISFAAYSLLSLYLILRVLKNRVFISGYNLYLKRGVQFLFALLFIENIIFISHTRPSLLFCGIGLVNLAFTPGIRIRYALLNAIIFSIGMLIRPESSVGMLVLVSIGYLMYNFNLKHLFKRFLFPITATAIMLSAYAIDWHYTDIFVKKVEPEIEYKLMDKRWIDISEMKTAEDSIKYQTALAGIWFDPNVITPNYLRSILLPGINFHPDHAYDVFVHTLSFYADYSFIILFIIVIIMLCFLQSNFCNRIFRIILFQIATFLLIFISDYNGFLMAGRHFLNLQLIALLITLFIFSSGIISINLNKRTAILLIVCFLFVSLGTGITVIHYKQKSDETADIVECYESAMKELEDLYTNQVIMVSVCNFHLFDHNFSGKNKKYIKNAYLLYDTFTYSLTPKYLSYLSNECSCNPLDPNAFFKWLSKTDALYMAEPWRFNLISKYMKLLHNVNIDFMLPENFNKPSCISNTAMRNFEVRNVIIK